MSLVKTRFGSAPFFFQRKKNGFECSQNEFEDDGHATRKKKEYHFPITFVAKIGFANRPTDTIISIALAMMTASSSFLKYYRENEWPSFIFFCARYQEKSKSTSNSYGLFHFLGSLKMELEICELVIWRWLWNDLSSLVQEESLIWIRFSD